MEESNKKHDFYNKQDDHLAITNDTKADKDDIEKDRKGLPRLHGGHRPMKKSKYSKIIKLSRLLLIGPWSNKKGYLQHDRLHFFDGKPIINDYPPNKMNYRLICMDCHKIFTNLFLYSLNNEPNLLKKASINIEEIEYEVYACKLENDRGSHGDSLLQISKGGFSIASYSRLGKHLYPGPILSFGHFYPNFGFIESEHPKWYLLFWLTDMYGKVEYTNHEYLQRCPWCGGITTQSVVNFSPKLIDNFIETSQNELKKSSSGNKLPKYSKIPSKSLIEGIESIFNEKNIKYNQEEIIELLKLFHLIKLNLWNYQYNQLGTFKKEYKVQSDRNNPKITIHTDIRGEQRQIYIGNYKPLNKDVLILSKKDEDNLILDNITNIRYIDRKSKLPKTLSLKKITNIFKTDMMALLFINDDNDAIYVPVPRSFLELETKEDFKNLWKITDTLKKISKLYEVTVSSVLKDTTLIHSFYLKKKIRNKFDHYDHDDKLEEIREILESIYGPITHA